MQKISVSLRLIVRSLFLFMLFDLNLRRRRRVGRDRIHAEQY